MQTDTTLRAVLARGAAIVADIHHSHGIKAALAVRHLRQRYPQWPEAFWQDALLRARWFDEPIVDRAAMAGGSPVRPDRARLVFARSVVPRAYTAIRAWVSSDDVDGIVAFYLGQAAADPGYLGHRLSILLALGQAWPLYRASEQRELFLDRLAEFLLASRFGADAEAGPSAAHASWDEACSAALRSPGYFGHNLICLAWIGRCRERLSQAQLRSSFGWVLVAARTTFADAEDNVSLAPADDADLSDAVLEQALHALLLRGTSNIHLLTLADAIAWLWDDLPPTARPFLLAMARHPVDSHGQ